MALRRPLTLIPLVVFFSTALYVLFYSPPQWEQIRWYGRPSLSERLDLGFITSTYVVSLPHRQDRRTDMDILMNNLLLSEWQFYDATYSNTSLVQNLMRHVYTQRADANFEESDWVNLPMTWPEDADETFTDPSVPYQSMVQDQANTAETWPDEVLPDVQIPPMMCAEDDFRLQKYVTDVPQWRFLTPERVATYHSHLALLRHIVDQNARNGVDPYRQPGRPQSDISLILEDDIDMEVDIEARLAPLIPLLPYDWDMLYLGFCWAQETQNPAIVGKYIRPTMNQLHPSFQPRCTHAYALSPAGAIRVLAHLRHPPFAYGRSIDTALEWLIWSKRINSYTVVPPPIIQRKVVTSDVTLVAFDHWSESLDDGVLGTTGDLV